MKRITIVVLTLLVVSCQSHVQIDATPSASSQVSMTRTPSATTMLPQPIMDTNHENIVLKDSSGVTMIYDVEERSTHTIALSEDCQLVGRILAAICRTDKGLVSIDLQSGLQMVIPVPSLNGDEQENGQLKFLYVHNLIFP